MNDDRIEIALNAGTLWRAVITLLRLFLGAWMLNSGYSYWAQEFGWPPAFPQPFGTLPASNQMLVTMVEVGLFDFVKTVEVIGGLCLIFGVFVPMAMLVSRWLSCSGRKSVRPIFLAVQRAVAGITCIRPEAPTCERASMMKRLSCRIRPYT